MAFSPILLSSAEVIHQPILRSSASEIHSSEPENPPIKEGFKIINSLPFDKETGKNYLLKQKMNVATRNFPLKPEEIKKKFNF